jgi:non-ribosomal peptide synthetase component E (peptide arylation enzyme)
MKAPYSRTLFDLLREQATRFPERIAVICGERAITYRDLRRGPEIDESGGVTISGRDSRRGGHHI